MPITNTRFVRTTALLLLAGLVTLLAIVGTTIWLVERTQVYFNEVVEAREARTATIELLTALQDIETGQRGFLLTLNQEYLEPYEAGIAEVWPNLERLEQILVAYPQAAEPMAKLRTDVEYKLDEVDRTIALAEEGNVAAAIAIVDTDAGKQAMDDSRVLFDALIRAADERLTVGVEDQRNSANALRIVTLLGAVGIIAVVGGSAWVVMSYTRELAAARRELESSNIRLEERVRERTADLASANEEVQRFAYIVTHDLRAPLVNIMGFTSELEASVAPIQQFMQRTQPTDDPVETEARLAANEDLPEALGFIRSSTRKMDGLINAILKISRDGRRAVKPESIDIAELLSNAANSVHHQVSELDGSIEIEPGLPTIVSDRLALEQIFGNVLDNAVKYSDPRRPLRIRLRGHQAPGNRLVVDIEDNGRGIDDKDHDRVFELFRRSGEQSKPGEGIGLAHVRTLVRNLGGDISLTSELGKGTTFRVTIAKDLRAIVGSSAA
jgi:signal transduction histidine kinase